MGFEPQDFAVTPKSLAAPVKRAVDKFQLLPEFLKVRGLVKQHIDSFNFFIEHDIKKIVKANNYFVSRQNSKIFIRYTGIRVLPPSYKVEFHKEDSRPHLCRLSDQTYAGDIEVKVVYNNGTYPQDKQMNAIIGRMPIMLRSRVCVLNGKDEAELAKLGECPLDPGGYFVVKGTEKVILIQEQLSKNRIIIDTDSKKRVTASVTCSTHEIKTKTILFMDKDKIYLQLNQFIKPIPIIIVMRAMGMENDQEIVQMVGRDRQYFELLLPSIQDCASEKIYTQEQAMEYLEGKAGNAKAGRPGIRKEGEARKILVDTFLANVPVKQGNFRPKCLYAAVMLRRMLDAVNTKTFDDKDYVGNKRLELSGQLISLLFEDLFKTMNDQAVDYVSRLCDRTTTEQPDFLKYIRKQEIITQGLERAISTGNWDLKRFRMHRKGVSQVLSRLSFIGAYGHMTRISPQFEKTRKVSGPRALQPSQWGMLCPCDTPEGEACGLTKNLALMTHVTTDEEEGPLISLVCRKCGLLGYYNHKLKTPFCSMCKNGESEDSLLFDV